MNVMCGFAVADGNLLTGWVLDQTGSWGAVFGLAIAHWIVGGVIYQRWAGVDAIF